MNESKPRVPPEEVDGPATPEDVAILYSWANLPGAKYRDFSASRREYRAQQRVRQAEEQRQAELSSARLLEEAARREMEEARRALDLAHREKREASAETQGEAEEAFRQASANASREREEAGRRQQSAETLRLRAQSARREMMDARKRAEDQAARYAEFDAQYRAQVDEREDKDDLPGQLDDPYYYTGQVDPAYFASTPGVRTAQATRTSTERKAYVFPVHPGSDEFDAGTLQAYRPGTTFAPSPVQDARASARLRAAAPTAEEEAERAQPAEQERRRGHDPEDVNNAAADNDYYSNSARGREGAAGTAASTGTRTMPRDIFRPPQKETSRAGEDAAPAHLSFPSVERRADNRGRRNAGMDPHARTVRQPRQDSVAGEFGREDAAGAVPPAWLDHRYRSGDGAEPSFLPVVQPGALAVGSAGHAEELQRVPLAEPRRFGETAAGLDVDDAFSASDAAGEGAFPTVPTAAPDTLQQSRERVASRWFALQGLMEQEPPQTAVAASLAPQPGSGHAFTVPIFAVLSLSGGVGKTSLVATLGRALSSLGEKVLLADTNTHGLLPYYFGARDLRPGAVRTFTPPAGSQNAPVLMVHYDLQAIGHDEAAQALLADDLTDRAAKAQRVLVDLSSQALWLARRLTSVSPFVLVPLAPDMNSILNTEATEATFAEMRDGAGQPIRPYYVLNQYDPSLPLHLDVREVLRRSLGDRLLPIVIHRAQAVSEALAEGMTVIDYAPGSTVAEEYRSLAQWMQGVASAGGTDAPGARWSER